MADLVTTGIAVLNLVILLVWIRTREQRDQANTAWLTQSNEHLWRLQGQVWQIMTVTGVGDVGTDVARHPRGTDTVGGVPSTPRSPGND